MFFLVRRLEAADEDDMKIARNSHGIETPGKNRAGSYHITPTDGLRIDIMQTPLRVVLRQLYVSRLYRKLANRVDTVFIIRSVFK